MIRKGYHGNSHIRKVKVVSGASVQPNLVWDIPEWKDKIQKRWKEMHVCFFQVCCFAVVQLLIFTTPWTAACQAPLSSSISWSLLKFKSIESGILSNHLILCCPFFLLPSIFPSIMVFSSVSAVCIRWPKYWSFSFSNSPSSEYSDWFSLGWTSWISLQSKGLSHNTCSINLSDSHIVHTQ